MLLTEYDEKKVMEYLKQEARDEGKTEGLAEGKANAIIDLVKDNLLSVEQGAVRLGISISQMSKMISVR